MEIGSNVKFYFKNRHGALRQVNITLSSRGLRENIMSDAEVIQRLSPSLQQMSEAALIEQGYILAARNLLNIHPDATVINICEENQQQDSTVTNTSGKMFILAILVFIVVIFCLSLLITRHC